MAVVQPHSFKSLAICLAAATIGSVISDIDVTTPKSRRELNRIIIISVVAIVVCTALEFIFHLGLVYYFSDCNFCEESLRVKQNLKRTEAMLLSFCFIKVYSFYIVSSKIISILTFFIYFHNSNILSFFYHH